MISRYTDSLEKAASRAKEMITSELSEKPRIFTEFLNSIKVAAGSAHQLAHSQVDHSTRWLALRDLLEKIIEAGVEIPTFGGSEKNYLWMSIKRSLENLSESGKKLFVSKALTKEVLNFELDQRFKNAPELSNG
jgi:hypothetical protein